MGPIGGLPNLGGTQSPMGVVAMHIVGPLQVVNTQKRIKLGNPNQATHFGPPKTTSKCLYNFSHIAQVANNCGALFTVNPPHHWTFLAAWPRLRDFFFVILGCNPPKTYSKCVGNQKLVHSFCMEKPF